MTWKISFTKNPAPANRTDSVFSFETCFGTEFWEFGSIFVPRNGIPSWFLFLKWCGTEWYGTEFREFSVLRNSQNSARVYQLFRLFRLSRNNFFVGNCQPYFQQDDSDFWDLHLTFFEWQLSNSASHWPAFFAIFSLFFLSEPRRLQMLDIGLKPWWWMFSYFFYLAVILKNKYFLFRSLPLN